MSRESEGHGTCHSDGCSRPAEHECIGCRHWFCDECSVSLGDNYYCRETCDPTMLD